MRRAVRSSLSCTGLLAHPDALGALACAGAARLPATRKGRTRKRARGLTCRGWLFAQPRRKCGEGEAGWDPHTTSSVGEAARSSHKKFAHRPCGRLVGHPHVREATRSSHGRTITSRRGAVRPPHAFLAVRSKTLHTRTLLWARNIRGPSSGRVDEEQGSPIRMTVL